MIDAGVAVDEKDPGGFHVAGHPVAGQIAAPAGGAFGIVAKQPNLFAQGFDLGYAVEAQELAPFAGGLIAELLEARHAAEGQISQEQEDGLHGIEALWQGEVALCMAQQAEGQQCGQGAEHAAVRDVIGGLKTRLGFLQHSERGGEALQRTRRAHTHGGFPVGDAAGALRGGRAGRGRDQRGRSTGTGLCRRLRAGSAQNRKAAVFFLRRP